MASVASFPKLNPDTEKQIRFSLLSFRTYLSRIGFQLPVQVPTIRVDNQSEETSVNVLTNEIWLGTSINKYPEDALWAYATSVLHPLLKPGVDSELSDLIDDYYSSSFQGKPAALRLRERSSPRSASGREWPAIAVV
jgi:hypothetical protein